MSYQIGVVGPCACGEEHLRRSSCHRRLPTFIHPLIPYSHVHISCSSYSYIGRAFKLDETRNFRTGLSLCSIVITPHHPGADVETRCSHFCMALLKLRRPGTSIHNNTLDSLEEANTSMISKVCCFHDGCMHQLTYVCPTAHRVKPDKLDQYKEAA